MTDKKIKPPRPPAPNFAPKKRTLPSTTISLKYNPLMGSDDDDDLNDDCERGISFITMKGNSQRGTQLAKSASLDGVPSLVKPDAKPNRPEQFSHSMDANYGKHKEEMTPVNKPVAKVREQDIRAQPPSSQTNEIEKKKATASTDLAEKPSKPTTTITGLMKVPSAILKEDKEASILPTDCEEATTDPLSFLDKMMEEQLENQALEEEAELEKKKRKQPSVNTTSLATHKRARSLDIDAYKSKEEPPADTLDVDPCYYTIPAPSELPDEAVIQRPISSDSPHTRHRRAPAKNMSLSLSGLLATSKDDTEEEENDISASTRSSRSTLDSPDGGKQEPIMDYELQTKSPSTPVAKEELSEVSPKTLKDTREHAVKEEATKTPSFPPVFVLSLLSLCLFVYFQFSLSHYMTGFFTGMLFMFYSMLFVIWLTMPTMSYKTESHVWDEEDFSTPLVIPGIPQSVSVVRSKEQKRVIQKPFAEEDEAKSQGWMNELPLTYDPDNYHTSQTQSVFVRLDGYSLRLSRPRYNIPRRAMYDEPAVHKVEFVHQRHYDMRDSKVYLLPSGLVKKRLWSKKYPICIELPKKGISIERKEASDGAEDVDARTMGFEYIKKEECDDRILYLFTRTSRDKEEWFWKFDIAAKYDKLERGRRPIPTLNKEVFLIGGELTKEGGSQHPHRADPDDMAARKGTIDFYRFMTKVMPKEKDLKEVAPQGLNVKAGNVTYASPARRQPKLEVNGLGGSPVDWVNGFVGRVFWDLLREDSWAELVKTKLQKKLSKLKVPYFLEELKITDIDLGVNSPQLRRISRPRLDDRGLWVDLDMVYSGSCMVSMTTKVNLWRLGKGEKFDKEMTEITPVKKDTKEKERTPSLAALDSEVEDSAESSDEETDDAFVSQEATVPSTEAEPSKGSGKIMRIVNKIASSKYFQSATQNKYIKRAMDEVSNTPVELTVEVKQLRGSLCVNIPPPPTDRFWFGFRNKPHLWLSAKPKLGARQVTLTHVTDYIEKKLELEFQKVFVLPNMDDVPVPIMTSNPFENVPF